MGVSWLARAVNIWAQGVEPIKVDIRNRGTQVENAIDALILGQGSSGGYVFSTKAEIDANLAFVANTLGYVYADGTPANNGVYKKSGGSGSGSWAKIADLPIGISGVDGADGADGTNGTNGTNGATGTPGTNGTNGASGADGADGEDAEALWPHNRPGENPELWTASLAGSEPDALAPLSSSLSSNGSDGRVVRIVGANVVASRQYLALEPARVYGLRYVVRRRGNTSDPAGDAVRMAVAWFDQSKVFLSSTTIFDHISLLVATGRYEESDLISRTGGSGITAAPANARYARPYVQTFGNNPITDVEVIDVVDVTDATLFDPDVSSIQADVDALESIDAGARLDAIEAQLDAPTKLTFLNQSDAEAETIPVTVQLITLVGLVTYDDRKGADYIRTSAGVGLVFTTVDGAQWKRHRTANLVANVADFGALEGGVSDVADAVQDACDYLENNGGGILLFPPGDWRFTAAGLVVGAINPAVSIRVMGSGKASTFLRTAADITVLNVGGSSSSIEELTVFGKGIGGDTGTLGATQHAVIFDSSNGYARKCRFWGGSSALHITSNATDNTFEDVDAGNSYGSACVTTTGSNWFIRCKFDHAPNATNMLTALPYPARANTTAYTVGQVRTSGGYVLVCSVAGTSGGSPPTLKNYGIAITDGSVTWEMVAPVGYAGVFILTGALENRFLQTDLTGSGFQYSIKIDAAGNYTTYTDGVMSSPVALENGGKFAMRGTDLGGPTISVAATFGGLVFIDQCVGIGPIDILVASDVNNVSVTHNFLNGGTVTIGPGTSDYTTVFGNKRATLVTTGVTGTHNTFGENHA